MNATTREPAHRPAANGRPVPASTAGAVAHPLAASGAAATAGDAPRLEFIERAHQRSAALGLSRGEQLRLDPMVRSDLAVARDRNQRLYRHAAPVMQLLFEQIVNTESMIVLTDAMGTILHSVGDDDFLQRADKVALAPGENWAEHAKGTNAIGTALFEGAPTLVHAHEHFIQANHFLTCSATPIFDPRGNMLGVLDVTGDERSYHQHTMGLVRMSARMIENHWLSDDFNNRLRLHFHGRAEFIGTLLEGIVAIAPDGKILGANRSALDQLGLSGAALRMQSATSLFGTTPAAIYDHYRAPMSAPMRLALPSGQVVHAAARFDWPSRPVVGGTAFDAVAVEARDERPGATSAESTLRERADVGSRGAAAAGAGDTAAWLGGEAATRRAEPSATAGLQYLLTGDARIEVVVQKVRRIVDRDIPLLILGETGTGKEVLARAVHHESSRARQPFVAVNCASIPESLIEAELFGHEDGAFTGARRKGAPGRIVQADRGTLFLDEIGDMPLALQARLLRVLQERSVTPLGSTKAIAVDIAVIGATHRNLRAMIDRHAFREDLYYRLNGLALRLPPLRERTDLEAVCRRLLRAERPLDTPVLGAAVLALFRRCRWPGNIRQLANVLRTAAVMASGDAEITPAHLADDFHEDLLREAAGAGALAVPDMSPVERAVEPVAFTAAPPAETPFDPSSRRGAVLPPVPSVPHTLEQAEIEMIRQVLASAGGNISAASKQLGISRNTIYRKLRWNGGDGPRA